MTADADSLPFAAACERNKAPILAVLRTVFHAPGMLLEIGAGTGQHAVYFAGNLPHLHWVATEAPNHVPLLLPRIAAAGLANLDGPRPLDVGQDSWPVTTTDGVYAANVAHIMGWHAVVAMFCGVGRILVPQGAFCLYGPFNDAGGFTSDSNAAFDATLRVRDPAMGIRAIAALEALAGEHGLVLEADHPLPANNRVLVWRKTG